MIEKRIRYFDDGGRTDSDSGAGSYGNYGGYTTGSDSNATDSASAEAAQAAYSGSGSSDGSDPNDMGPPENPNLMGPPENPNLMGPQEDPNQMGPQMQYRPAQDSADAYNTWDNLKAYVNGSLPSWQTVGNIASMFVPALRVPMMVANTAKSVSDDPSAGNIASNLLAAPLAKATGLNSGAIASLFKGDVGNAVGNQVVGAGLGELYKAAGPDVGRVLSLANSATGASGEAKQAIASAINNAMNDRSTSVTQAQGLSPTEAAYALQGRGGDTGMLASAPTRSNPVVASISNILGVKPTAAKGKTAPIDIVEQLMAMQNQTGNLKSVPASTGGSIDDLIRLTRS